MEICPSGDRTDTYGQTNGRKDMTKKICNFMQLCTWYWKRDSILLLGWV